MFKIPEAFRREEEQYITLPVLKKFIKEHDLGKSSDFKVKSDYLEALETFASTNSDNAEVNGYVLYQVMLVI